MLSPPLKVQEEEASSAQAQAHDEMMENQKGGGVGGAMGAVGMDSMGRWVSARSLQQSAPVHRNMLSVGLKMR